MEYCSSGTLKDADHSKLNENQCIEIVNQLLEGLYELHLNLIVHNDIKPSNIFVQNNIFKIGDFG